MRLETFWNGWTLAVALSLVIAIWALVEHFRYRRQFQALEKSVRDGIGVLSSATGPTEFYRLFTTLGRKLADNPVLGNRWKEYQASLLPARKDKPLRSPRAPAEFFDEDLYRQSNIDIRAYEALPNQFVGVGLCLTFLGLIVTLILAHDVIVADPRVAGVQLARLLEAASFKFITSVCALIASICFIFAKNRRLYRTEKEIASFCAKLELLILPVTPEELAEESNWELARHGEQLTKANHILAVGIADALEQKLTTAMVTATEPMIDAMRTMTARISDMNRTALEHMAKRFADTLAGAAQAHTDRMADMLKAAADAIGDAPEQIRLASQTVAAEVKTGGAAFEQSMESWTGRMNGAADAAAADLQQRVAAQAELLATGLRQEGAALLESLAEVADRLTTAPERLNEAGSAYAEVVARATAELESAVGKAGQGLAGSLDQAADKIDTSLGSMEQLIARTEQTAAAVGSVTERVLGQIETVLNGAAQLTGRLETLTENASVAAGAAESMAEIAGRMEKLSESLSIGVGELGQIATANQSVLTETQRLVEQLRARGESMANEASALQDKIAAAFETAAAGFGNLGDRTGAFVQQLDAGMARSLDRFQQVLAEFDRVAETIVGQRQEAPPRDHPGANPLSRAAE